MISQANVTVMVSDMNKAVEFYHQILGLKVKARYGKDFAQLEAPGTIIALHPAVEGGPRPGSSGNISIGFAVNDLDKAMKELRDKGVHFSRVTDDSQVKLAFFTDPDGNSLYLSKSKWG